METELKFIKDDITKLKVDVIINSISPTGINSGKIQVPISQTAGPGLIEEYKKLGVCQTGQVKITKGYKLPAKYVIHTLSPVWLDGKHNEDFLLASCYRNAFSLAKKNKFKTIAFPSIGTQNHCFPVEIAAPIALKTTKSFLKQNPSVFIRILFVLSSDKDFLVFSNLSRVINYL